MLVNRRRVTIEWGDCDPAQIVFYPRYFAFFDAATQALFTTALGMTMPELCRRFACIGFPMVDTRARFLVPSRAGDEVEILTEIAAFRRSSFDVRHRLMRKDRLAVEGFETRVWAGVDPADPSRLTSKPIPPDVLARLGGGS